MRNDKTTRKGKNMNTLDCKVCETPTECSEDAVTVTCSDCVNENIDSPDVFDFWITIFGVINPFRS